MDEDLLRALDADEDVQKIGRSAVFRRITAEYLDSRRRTEISAAYNQAYGKGFSGLDDEFAEWENEGVWPKE